MLTRNLNAVNHPFNKPIKTEPKRVRLGRSDFEISPVGTGTWQWGGAFYWGYGRSYTDEDLAAAYSASIENGINWFDTAEIYGRGKSEIILGRHVNGSTSINPNSSSTPKPLVATKFFPYPWRFHKSSFRRALKASLKRLNAESIDIYQIHFPFRPRNFEYWVDALGDAAQDGLVKAVGVSNFSAEQTKIAHELLARKGIVLAANQVGYSLLNRKIESNGVLETCSDLDVSVIAYGPLAEGLLTGKYLPGIPPPFMRKWRWARKRLKMLPPLISLMSDIASAHGASPSQVALNWLILHGTLPIPGAKSAMQAKDNAASMRWSLSSDELEALNVASVRYLPTR